MFASLYQWTWSPWALPVPTVSWVNITWVFFYMFEPLDMAQQLMDGLVFATHFQWTWSPWALAIPGVCGFFFYWFFISLWRHWSRPYSCWMDLCLQLFVNEFEAQGTADTGNVLVEHFFIFFFHFWATGLGLAADAWTCVCNSLSMNLKLQGTAGTDSVLGECYLSFFFHFWATGLGPTADGWTCVCNSFSTTWRPLGTAGTNSV
jgi:hypothetical protein